MGTRGRTKQFGDRTQVRFTAGVAAQLRIMSAMEGVAVPHMIRILVSEAIARRDTIRKEGASDGA